MNDTKSPTESYQNILSNDVTIVGSLKFTNDLVVDGSIEGEVVSEGNLTVGDNARIKGEIKTRSVVVYGTVEGNVTVDERCILKSSANLMGDVSAGMLSIEEGACFSGRSSVGAKRPDAKATSKK
jgi:cytoskeletal protein CcmA (bactofilin family)